jgi:leucyl/phenylalanyl-tRNA--protein transferase
MVDPESGFIEWIEPGIRGVIPLVPPSAFHVPRNLGREVRKARFQIRSDRAFETVMRLCATDRAPDNRTWIDDRLIAAYVALHRAGHAHSIEAWLGDELVGGLYGVHIGGAFFGESMFSRPQQGGSNSSKVCLVHLVEWLRQRGFMLLDVQFWNPHLEQFGCERMARREYATLLAEALKVNATWGEFTA